MRAGAGLSLLLLAAGCGSAGGAVFRGARAPAVAAPADIAEAAALPPEHSVIGRVGAECTLPAAVAPWDGARLADVDCGVDRLVAALGEAAADAGGTLLVARACASRPEAHGTLVRCSADVARADSGELWRRGAAASTVQRVPSAAEAWAIRIRYAPVASERPPRRAELVRQLAELPVYDVRLGDIVAECDSGCTRDGASSAVRSVAGRVGANDVVGVHCTQRDEGWSCSGHAAAYEVDPNLDERAR